MGLSCFGAISGIGLDGWMGWLDLCAGLLYEHRFAMLIIGYPINTILYQWRYSGVFIYLIYIFQLDIAYVKNLPTNSHTQSKEQILGCVADIYRTQLSLGSDLWVRSL